MEYVSDQFLRRPVHCGNAPPYFYSLPAKQTYVPHILMHRGLMNPNDRKNKTIRYEKYDPYAIHKGEEYYDSLKIEATGSIYDQEQILQKLQVMCEQL